MSKALLVVDMQYDFLPGGNLAVENGDSIIGKVNTLIDAFDIVILTQDWHPANHVSFAVNHPGENLFSVIKTKDGSQVLWPEHCVQGTKGAEIDSRVKTDKACAIIRKGMHSDRDSYSAFLEADRSTKTGLDGYLKSIGVKEIYVAGLATDFCVSWSSIDARHFGFDSYVVMDAAAAIDVNGSLSDARKEWGQVGVKETCVDKVLDSLKSMR